MLDDRSAHPFEDSTAHLRFVCACPAHDTCPETAQRGARAPGVHRVYCRADDDADNKSFLKRPQVVFVALHRGSSRCVNVVLLASQNRHYILRSMALMRFALLVKNSRALLERLQSHRDMRLNAIGHPRAVHTRLSRSLALSSRRRRRLDGSTATWSALDDERESSSWSCRHAKQHSQ